MKKVNRRLCGKKVALEAVAKEVARTFRDHWTVDISRTAIMWTRNVKRTGSSVRFELYAEDDLSNEALDTNTKFVDSRKFKITVEEV